MLCTACVHIANSMSTAHVRMSNETHETLQKLSKSYGMPMSTLIRIAVDNLARKSSLQYAPSGKSNRAAKRNFQPPTSGGRRAGSRKQSRGGEGLKKNT